ncbi:NUDIX domain-containing protein [Nocardia sp. NPDC060249]|uniref:NUDIX hydrolase n=1 Tax=Nocardia sp. NPDC060249 TaxID=3347082 RepID=UPI0036583847
MRPQDQTFDRNTNAMQKVGAVIIHDRKIMVVRKKNEEQLECIMPGGRMELGESQLECLTRELAEELNVRLLREEYIGTYKDIAVFEGVPLVIHAYLAIIEGDPMPANEIKEFLWIDSAFEQDGIRVGSIMARKVIPEMKRRDIID